MDDPILIAVTILPVLLLIVFLIALYLFIKLRKVQIHYNPIINIDKEVAKSKNALEQLQKDHAEFTAETRVRCEQLSSQYREAKNIYDKLKNEIALLEENLEDISYGFYRPHFDFQSSDGYKIKLTETRERERELIHSGQAVVCSMIWSVGGSEKEGARMARQNMKLILRAFNGECDAALAKVTWNNILKMEERIKKSYDMVNQLGSVMQVSITEEYLQLKLEELRLTFELEDKRHQEQEEQRSIREQMKEEEKAQREIENARREAEKEEERFEKALQIARAEAACATGDNILKLNEQIKLLESKLENARLQKDRAISRAQLTKSGHVYVISNMGSFGENVYKVGMTRRLEPLDRIGELSNASVPFSFDVHAMMYSENAPELESALHGLLERYRVNLVNPRKEFFNVNLFEIERIARSRGIKIEFTKIAEAREYRESIALRQANVPQSGIRSSELIRT